MPTEDVIVRAAAAATEGVDVNEDLHASADYRRALAATFVHRSLEKAVERARGERPR